MRARSEIRQDAFDRLMVEVRACARCAAHLPLGPRPVLRGLRLGAASHPQPGAGHARSTRPAFPSTTAAATGCAHWLGIDRDTFYDERRIAILPMGLCYPGPLCRRAAICRRGRNARRSGMGACSPPGPRSS